MTDLEMNVLADEPLTVEIRFVVNVSPTATLATLIHATRQSPDQFTIEVTDLRAGDGQLSTTGGPYNGTMVRQ